ncbi:RNA methyltransferase [Cytobacillus suaedae]|nr:RNA methyltransferase [Cytobacillus suaedae]
MKRIESVKNVQVKQWKKLQTKKERELSKTFIIEGFHLVEEALKTKDIVREIIVSESVTIPSTLNVDNVNITIVTVEVMKFISETENSQGIAAVCEQFQYTNTKFSKLLLVDAVQDPGNLGTMIRTADAAGLDAVIVGDGSVDVYNSKVIRSTQGAIFHLPIIKANLEEWIVSLQEEKIDIYGTALDDRAVYYKEVTSKESFALLVGNEGSGVNPNLLNQTTKNLYIPIHGKSESLNVAVATGILLYHLQN